MERYRCTLNWSIIAGPQVFPMASNYVSGWMYGDSQCVLCRGISRIVRRREVNRSNLRFIYLGIWEGKEIGISEGSGAGKVDYVKLRRLTAHAYLPSYPRYLSTFVVEHSLRYDLPP